MAVLKRRLEGRGTEDSQQVAARLNQAKKEIEQMHRYDYIVVNDQLEDCVDKVRRIIEALHERACQKNELISSFREEMTRMKL